LTVKNTTRNTTEWPEDGGGFDFLRREVEVNIQCSIVARGGGGFDFL